MHDVHPNAMYVLKMRTRVATVKAMIAQLRIEGASKDNVWSENCTNTLNECELTKIKTRIACLKKN